MTTWEDDRSSDDIAAQRKKELACSDCGHTLDQHHRLGPCIVVTGLGGYCECTDWR